MYISSTTKYIHLYFPLILLHSSIAKYNPVYLWLESLWVAQTNMVNPLAASNKITDTVKVETLLYTVVIRQLRPKFKFPAKIEMAFS